jgi:hypothetical protein
VLFSLVHTVWLAAPLLALAGGGFIVQMASTNTIIVRPIYIERGIIVEPPVDPGTATP